MRRVPLRGHGPSLGLESDRERTVRRPRFASHVREVFEHARHALLHLPRICPQVGKLVIARGQQAGGLGMTRLPSVLRRVAMHPLA